MLGGGAQTWLQSGSLRNHPAHSAVNAPALLTGICCALLAVSQTAGIFFQPSFMTSADSAGPALLVPLLQILSLGLSAAAVTNYVQSVSPSCSFL